MNKKSLIFALFAVAVLLLASCSSKKGAEPMSYEEAKAEFIDEPTMTLSANDTAEVNKLIENYLGTLRTYDVAGAVAQLKYQVADSVVDLPAKDKEKQMNMLNMFKGIKYELDYISFLKETDCAAKYTVTLFEIKDENDTRPNKISFMLKPVRWKNKWYLTLADSENNKVAPSEISQY